MFCNNTTLTHKQITHKQMTTLNPLNLMNNKTTNTYHLVDALCHMHGEALEAVKQILMQSLEVNKIHERGADAALLFTKWHAAGELDKHLICMVARAEYRAEILAFIESELEYLESSWEEVGPEFLDDESYRLQKYYAWVNDPVAYLKKYN